MTYFYSHLIIKYMIMLLVLNYKLYFYLHLCNYFSIQLIFNFYLSMNHKIQIQLIDPKVIYFFIYFFKLDMNNNFLETKYSWIVLQ